MQHCVTIYLRISWWTTYYIGTGSWVPLPLGGGTTGWGDGPEAVGGGLGRDGRAGARAMEPRTRPSATSGSLRTSRMVRGAPGPDIIRRSLAAVLRLGLWKRWCRKQHISGCTHRLIAWLQRCLEKAELPHKISPSDHLWQIFLMRHGATKSVPPLDAIYTPVVFSGKRW